MRCYCTRRASPGPPPRTARSSPLAGGTGHPLTGWCQPYHPWYGSLMADTRTPALASTATITRSSHPAFTYFTTTEACIEGVGMGQRARHDHAAAEVDAHLDAM